MPSSPEPRFPLTEEQLKQFKRDGYIIVKNRIQQTQLDALSKELSGVLDSLIRKLHASKLIAASVAPDGASGFDVAYETIDALIALDFDSRYHAVIEQIAYQRSVVCLRRVGAEAVVVLHEALDVTVLDDDLLHPSGLHVRDELRVVDLMARCASLPEVVEHRHQHQSDDDPEN